MMTATRYYRHYLWIFFYLFFILFGVAIAVAIIKDSSSSGGGGGGAKLVRFLYVLVCFIFGGSGVFLQTYGTKKLLGLELLNVDRRNWKKKYVHIKKKTCKKKCNSHKIIFLFTLHMASNLISLMPFLIMGILALALANVWSSVQSSIKFNECKWFFCAGILIKHAAWYLTSLSAKLSIFWRKERLNNMI